MRYSIFFSLALFFCGLYSIAQQVNPPQKISGIYPHLKMYNLTNREAGVGAVVPWAGKLWAITYTASDPFNGEDKLYEINPDMSYTIRPESIGGTHANRMIHKESEQLIIGPYFIDKKGHIRSIPATAMPGRLTGTARHPGDPANKVYFYAMEEGLYEVNVHTLEVKTLFKDGSAMRKETGTIDRPHLFGSHGKGAYSGQGKLVVSHNGILDFSVQKEGVGVLAEWDGKSWNEIDRKQYVEVTGPGGIYGNAKDDDPIWATGWDHRSAVLRVKDNHKWSEYRLPKNSFTYDGINGFNTEWPRIREAGKAGYLMTMHGMFWKFPKSFTSGNSGGIEPLSSYLKIVGDYTWWNDHIVLGTDDASTFGNRFVEKATHSNLWFLKPEELQKLGPKSGFGGVWINEPVSGSVPSSPFLLSGFDNRVLHLSHSSDREVRFNLEIDTQGNNRWKKYKEIAVGERGYAYYLFPPGFKTTWVRISTETDAENVTAYFILSEKSKDNPGKAPFVSIPDTRISKKDAIYHGLVRPGTDNELNLQFVAYETGADGKTRETGYYEVNGNMEIVPVKNDSIKNRILENFDINQPDFQVDDASAIVVDKAGNRVRLPKGSIDFDKRYPEISLRGVREVVTERSLLNCLGTFFEFPRDYSGGIAKIKPITTHNRLIVDFCSWRGLMTISGNFSGSAKDGHYFASTDDKTGLWFGGIDDLWKFGRPKGVGGPWNNTSVTGNRPSDPYLMLGYDNKSLKLSHKHPEIVRFKLEVDIAATGQWATFKTIEVKPGETFSFTFPEGYSAHWVRFTADKDCTATAWLTYE